MNWNKKYTIKFYRGAAILLLILFAFSMAGCGLIPTEEQTHKLNIVTEDASSKYDLAMAEIRDVSLTKNIVCTYSQLNEIKMYFPISGRKVSSVYVLEGDSVNEGDLLASLDVSSLENEIVTYTEKIMEAELTITQQQELIDFYQERIDSPKTGLRDKEEYSLKIQQCQEKITICESAIEYSSSKIESNQKIIDQSYLYSPVTGTVYYVKDDLQGWTSSKDTLVMKLLDSSDCAFKATDKAACQYLEVGDAVTVSRSTGETYSAKVTLVEPEKGDLVFELYEPDFSIGVGTRANIYLVVAEKEQVLSVPRIAVYGTEDNYYVYVLSAEGVRETAEVEVGLIGDTYAEILSGLELYSSVIVR